MMQIVDNSEITKVQNLIRTHFGDTIENDPFVHYLKYEDWKGILSYSLIYDRLELNYIWVEHSYRRQGIGEQLLYFLDTIAEEQKVSNISLEVECSNTPAISLYLKFGYKIVATREKYYQGKDGYLMVKEMIK